VAGGLFNKGTRGGVSYSTLDRLINGGRATVRQLRTTKPEQRPQHVVDAADLEEPEPEDDQLAPVERVDDGFESPNRPPGDPGAMPQHAPGAMPAPNAFGKDATQSQVEAEWARVADPVHGFEFFCRKYVYINNQQHGYVHFKLYDYQKRAAKLLQNEKFVITRKFRQAGMSLLTGVYCLWYSLCNPRMQCMIISIGQRESSKYLQENVREIYEALPRFLRGGLDDKRRPIPYARTKAPKDSATEIRLPNNSKIRSIPSGKAGGRSFSTKLLVIDEAAFIERIEDIWGGIYSTISNTNGSVFVVSTVNGVGGVGGWYYQTYQGAVAGENSFSVASMDYTEHPDYNNPDWVQKTRSNIGERRWRQEVLGEFLASGNTFIDADKIAELETIIKAEPEPPRSELGGKLLVWKDYVPGHHYAIGADCATRGGLDFSTAQVVDTDAGEQVAEYRGKLAEDEFAKILAQLGYRYGTALIVPEMNAKAGGAVTTSLANVERYKRLYRQENGDVGWNTTVRTRDLLISQFEASFYAQEWKIHSLRLIEELKTFIVTKTGKVEHDHHSHDDLLFAFFIATTAEVTRKASKSVPRQPQSFTQVREETQDGIVVTTRPVYSDADQKENLKKARAEIIAGTEIGEQKDRYDSINELAGEDVLAWLLKK
jgi:hypothetical protein